MGKLNIVVLGDGLLGSEIVKQTNWDYLSRKKDNINFTDTDSYFHLLKKYKVILNCIACTDTYSDNKELHYNVNYRYVVKLARYCEIHNKKLIHISSDYVYSNNTNVPSEEDIPHHADNWYSYTKLLGDNAVQVESDNNLVIRCTHKSTPFPYNKAWVDQVGNFDYVDVISSLIIKAINKQLTGLYNIGTEQKSMYELASKTATVNKSYTPKHVPKNVSMNISKFNNDIKTSFFSIAIPTYEMNGYGREFLEHSFKILYSQTFKDFEVVISDHSLDDRIKDLCKEYSKLLNVRYLRNTYKRGGSSPNINNAIKNCTGKWIKILYQDDFLYKNTALEKLTNHIIDNKDKVWIVSACEHTNDGSTMYRPFYPKWNQYMHLGNNTFSSPSVLTLKNIKDKLYFNEDLIWLMDVEYYKRMYDIYGEPSYLHQVNIVNRTWSGSVTDTLSPERKQSEVNLMRKTYIC